MGERQNPQQAQVSLSQMGSHVAQAGLQFLISQGLNYRDTLLHPVYVTTGVEPRASCKLSHVPRPLCSFIETRACSINSFLSIECLWHSRPWEAESTVDLHSLTHFCLSLWSSLIISPIPFPSMMNSTSTFSLYGSPQVREEIQDRFSAPESALHNFQCYIKLCNYIIRRNKFPFLL